MKIVKYIGGLGNQMFIYAFSVALRETFKQEILVDTHYYKSFKFHQGLEISKVFGVELKEAKVWDILRMAWYFPNYWIDYHFLKYLPRKKTMQGELPGGVMNEAVFQDPSDKYYDGYWQNCEFFNQFKDVIMRELTFKPKLTGKNKEIIGKILEDSTVGIHVRRGDYLNNWRYKGLCGIDYYTKAISFIQEKITHPKYFLFSDDIEYLEQNIVPLLKDAEYTIVNWNRGADSYIDMQLMSCCNHLIIANSSFSWWAAYLNKRNPIVVAPEKWSNNTDVKFRRQAPGWITF